MEDSGSDIATPGTAPALASAGNLQPAVAAAATGTPTLTEEVPTAMLDVHSPHGAPRTWIDFWIHLGTISIGLLIAIGLEQSVEAVHRLHQRYQLEEDLQTEARQNLAVMVKDQQHADLIRPWLTQLRNSVEQARKSAGKITFEYPAAPRIVPLEWPEAPSWNIAKASTQVALLPRIEARMYDFLYSEQAVLKERVYAYSDALDALRRFESRFATFKTSESHSDGEKTDPMGDFSFGSIYHDTPIPDLSQMAPEDLREYSTLLNSALTELGRLHIYNNAIYQWTRAVTLGAKSEDQLRRLVGGAQLSYESSTDASAAPRASTAVDH